MSHDTECRCKETIDDLASAPGEPATWAGAARMRLAPALLEEWMRRFYFATDFDIGSSGVEDFSLAEIRRLTGLTLEELDELVFHDSQTLGASALRRAIGERLARGRTESVMVTHGSTDANFMIMHALLEPGDEVLVLDPCYQQLYGIAEAMGCRLRHWQLRAEWGWRPDLAALDRALTPDTRMIVVNFPHNPTGASLTPAEQEALVAAAARVGAYLVWDGAFGELTYDEAPLPLPIDYPRSLSMGTLSKAYGLPGLRVGWCIAAPELLARLARIRDYTTLHLSPLVERIAERAIQSADRLLGLRREQARANREVVGAWIAAQGGAVEWVPPQGGVSCFVRFSAVDIDDLCLRLAREQRVLLVPGSCFGQPEFARLGFGGSPESLREGLARLSHVLDGLPIRTTTIKQVPDDRELTTS
jgi:capreomycidine synthase